MTKENTNTIARYNNYRKAQKAAGAFSLEALKKQIEKLHGQEFMMNVPIGGAADGR